jgi:hypothetical protein
MASPASATVTERRFLALDGFPAKPGGTQQAGRTSAPIVPHFEHSMIDPNSNVGISGGHWSTSTTAL